MNFADFVKIIGGKIKMIGKIEKINHKTDVKGRVYETVLVAGDWLINREEDLQGVLTEGMEYDFNVVTDGRWTTIKGILPVIDESKPEPEEPSLDEPQIEQKSEPCSRDESIVRQVAYKVAGETLKAVDMKPKEDAMKMLQDFAHVIAFDILHGEKWGK